MLAILVVIQIFGFLNAYNFEDCIGKPQSLAQVHKISGKLHAYSLDYFHQQSLPYGPMYAFTDVFLQTNLTDPDSYSFYQGENCSTVLAHYENDNRYFGLWKRAAMMRSHHLSPFNDTIIGVSTSLPYEISVQVWKVNIIRLSVFVGAVFLFLLAGTLVRNVIFYYTSGCSFGILASLLLVAFIVWRVAPKKTIGVPILIGGWSVSLYMLHFAWSNLQSILVEYQKYVIGYFTTVLLISLAVCYKRGPPTDARSHDIAQWTLQLLALTLIYFSSQVIEVTVATTIVLLVHYFSRGYMFSGIRWYFVGLGCFWSRVFPKSRKLLTEEEYEEEGRRTTREQLDLLKQYCQNERNRPWKLAANVRSARRNRLARFVEGEDGHVTEDERYAHELTSDLLLDRDDFHEEPHSFYDNEEEDENDGEWDEVVVLRRGNSRGSEVRTVRVPSNVTTRLLSPYERANKTYNSGYDRRGGDWGELGDRMFPELAVSQERRPMTEVRPTRNQKEQVPRRFDREELEQVREQLRERKRQTEREEARISSARSSRRSSTTNQPTTSRKSSSSVISSSESGGISKKSPRKSLLPSRRRAVIESDSE